jgi:pilus assembly protein Flp/PilA
MRYANAIANRGYSMNKLFASIRSFATEQDGAQIIEYALIIAVVSIVLVIALRDLTGSNFNGFIGRVANCLTANTTCV